jgi:HNH endonuclease
MTESLSLTPSELARFNSFLDKHDEEHPGCHTWTGATARGGGKSGKYRRGPGYGIFQATTLQPKTRRAHKLAYEIWVRRVPDGYQVQHRCNNPLCCNPDHLILGTPRQNSRYMVETGRAPTGMRHGKAKLTTEQVQRIFELCEARQPYSVVADKFNISEGHVRNIHRGRRRVLNDPFNTPPSDRPSDKRAFT